MFGVVSCVGSFRSRSVISCFHVLEYWHETCCYYVHSGQINRVCLVMPCCMFSMQLFLSEIVKFHFDQN